MAFDRAALKKASKALQKSDTSERTHIDLGLIAGSILKNTTAFMESDDPDAMADRFIADLEKVEGFVDMLEEDKEGVFASDSTHELVESFKRKKSKRPAFLMSDEEKKKLAEEKAKKEKGDTTKGEDEGTETQKSDDGWESDMAPKLKFPKSKLERMTKREVPVRARRHERTMEKWDRARANMMDRAAGDTSRSMS